MIVHRAPHPTIDVELESRSMLLHDLAHFAVEVHTQTPEGFYGLLAVGVEITSLRENRVSDPAVWDALMAIEMRVARLQSDFKMRGASEDPAVAGLRRAWGAWRKVQMGQTLRLTWPAGEITVQ